MSGASMSDQEQVKDAGAQLIGKVCREFVVLCRRLELFSEASVAIDGSKFKAVNVRSELHPGQDAAEAGAD